MNIVIFQTGNKLKDLRDQIDSEKHEDLFLEQSLKESKKIGMDLNTQLSELQLQIQELKDLKAEMSIIQESVYSSRESVKLVEATDNFVSASIIETNVYQNWNKADQSVAIEADDSMVITDYDETKDYSQTKQLDQSQSVDELNQASTNLGKIDEFLQSMKSSQSSAHFFYAKHEFQDIKERFQANIKYLEKRNESCLRDRHRYLKTGQLENYQNFIEQQFKIDFFRLPLIFKIWLNSVSRTKINIAKRLNEGNDPEV